MPSEPTYSRTASCKFIFLITPHHQMFTIYPPLLSPLPPTAHETISRELHVRNVLRD